MQIGNQFGNIVTNVKFYCIFSNSPIRLNQKLIFSLLKNKISRKLNLWIF